MPGWPNLWVYDGMISIYTCCHGVIINNDFFHFQKCLCLKKEKMITLRMDDILR